MTNDITTRGSWAGKVAAHSAHHRFGSRGMLPHVQVNVWRVGVKGSGMAYRLPMGPSLAASTRMLLPLLGILGR